MVALFVCRFTLFFPTKKESAMRFQLSYKIPTK